MNYERLIGSIAILFVVSLIIERALSVPLEWKYFEKHLKGMGLKTVIAALVSWGVCTYYHFDFFAMALDKDEGRIGILITALFVSGGSKFVLSFMRRITKAKQELI